MQKRWEVTAIWRSGFPSTVFIWAVNRVRASKEPSENASDSCGESLLQLKCFSRSPRYSLWMLLPGKYGVFLFVCIKKHVNKETALAAYLAQALQFTSVNLFGQRDEKIKVQKKEKKKTVKFWKREKARIWFLNLEIYCNLSHFQYESLISFFH